MKLAIISHTPHYNKDGVTVGWGSTVTEINRLTEIFDEIFHIAPLHSGEVPGSSLPYLGEKIKFIPLKTYGGEKISEKFSVISTAGHNLGQIGSVLKKLEKTDWVQFRAPTSMGLYVLPYLRLKNKSNLWVKYAGNWKMENPPFSYSFQKWWLENNFQRSKVTINGYWEGQKDHIINFQNPCLDTDELQKANKIGENKNFDSRLNICFVGSLTKNKGIEILLEALGKINRKEEIEEVVLAGDGNERKKYEEIASGLNIKILFKGFINRDELKLIYGKSHLIILPSESEGFPKVIAEAAAYGCVPIVSDVSSISQYFDDSKGFLLKKINADELAIKIDEAISNRKILKEKSLSCMKVSEIFTYDHYLNSLREKIFNDKITA